MKTYKFETTVQENGDIQIPKISRLANQRVEVFIVVSPLITGDNNKSQIIEDFLNKWRGFLKGFDPDELKSQYLLEKYQ
ncbi:MAG: hypothetical protein JW981_01150 [Anaerolineae bacterium]|nr:hypothetical protein [Anaerolineae bacterium]